MSEPSPLEPIDAAMRVLREEGRPLHWTAIQDLALKRGYLDPFVQRDLRKRIVAGLASAARDGTVVRESTGVYRLP
jgi:HB1, ASXL, restriction endonuclease HTH domain